MLHIEKMAFGELIYSDHPMLFTDQHSLGPKTTELVRVAEIESFASSNDNIVIARSLINVLFVLATREDGLQTISVRVRFLFKAFLVQQKNKATRHNINTCQTVRLNRRELICACHSVNGVVHASDASADSRRLSGVFPLAVTGISYNGPKPPEQPPNSCHSTRHLAFATLLHDRMVIVGRPLGV